MEPKLKDEQKKTKVVYSNKPRIMRMVLIVLAILLILFETIFYATHQLIKLNFGRGSYPNYATADYFYEHYAAEYPRTAVSFYSGENCLQGYIYGADNTLGLLVLVHGIGGHENYMSEIVWFVDHGWRVFAYDATGSCESEGNSTVGLVQSALDLDAALSYIESDPSLQELPICLMGHSWGGYATAAGLAFDHEVAASVSIAAYAKPTDMMMQYGTYYAGTIAKVLSPLMYLDNLAVFGEHASLSAIDGINRRDIPVLVIHGSEDELIPLESLSIMAYQDEITNPNVVYKVIEAEGQNGHSSMFYDATALPYIDQVNKAYEELFEAYDGEIPTDVRDAFYQELDKDLINTPNEELMQEIHLFFLRALNTEA